MTKSTSEDGLIRAENEGYSAFNVWDSALAVNPYEYGSKLFYAFERGYADAEAEENA